MGTFKMRVLMLALLGIGLESSGFVRADDTMHKALSR